MEIFISGNVPSSKNSKVMTERGLFVSRTVTRYLRSKGIKNYSVSKRHVIEYITRPNIFALEVKSLKIKKYPVKMYFHFVRDTRRKFDFHNAVQIIADLLVAHRVIIDDNMDYFLPFPCKRNGKWYTVDKDNAGVYILIDEI